MAKNKFSSSLSWDDFQSLGNPENIDDAHTEESNDEKTPDFSAVVRIHLEKKGRGGKQVTLIKGLTLDDHQLNDLAKSLKSTCGVGGSVKDHQIILQGNVRKKVLEQLKKDGYRDVKMAGS